MENNNTEYINTNNTGKEYARYLKMLKTITLTSPEFEEVCKGMRSILNKNKKNEHKFSIEEVKEMAKAFIESYMFVPDTLPDNEHWIYICDLDGLVKECPICGTQTMGFDKECPYCHNQLEA